MADPNTPGATGTDPGAVPVETRYAISERELDRYASFLRYRTAFFATGSACLAFALSIWMGAELDLGEWHARLPDGLWAMQDHAVPILSAISLGFYALGALFSFRARRLADLVKGRRL